MTDKDKELKYPNSSKCSVENKIRNVSNNTNNPLESVRGRCNSRGLLKSSAVPLKTIDMNQFGNNGKHHQSRTNLHNIVKPEDPP